MILPCSGKHIISNHCPNIEMAKQVYYFKVKTLANVRMEKGTFKGVFPER